MLALAHLEAINWMEQSAHTYYHPEYYREEFEKRGRPQMLIGVRAL